MRGLLNLPDDTSNSIVDFKTFALALSTNLKSPKRIIQVERIIIKN